VFFLSFVGARRSKTSKQTMTMKTKSMKVKGRLLGRQRGSEMENNRGLRKSKMG
jgi:hypothetical protein